MTFRRLILSALFVFPPLCSAASKEMLELQREVAQLEDQVRNLQSAFDTKMAALTVLVQQTVDASNKSNTALAALQGGIQEQMRQQGKEVVGPVATVGAKVDQMTTEFTEVRNSMADVTTRLGKLEQQIIDLSNAVRTMQTPAAPPPGATSPSPTASNMPPIPAAALYANADQHRGATAVNVGEFAVKRGKRRRGDQESGDQPRQIVHLAEVAADRRQGGSQDRLVDGAEEDRQHHAHGNQPLFAMRERLRIGRGQARWGNGGNRFPAAFDSAPGMRVIHEANSRCDPRPQRPRRK